MTTKSLNARITQRIGTAAAWKSANPVLLAGEVGWESDTKKSKLGDGTTAWNSLAYSINNDSSVSITTSDAVTSAITSIFG